MAYQNNPHGFSGQNRQGQPWNGQRSGAGGFNSGGNRNEPPLSTEPLELPENYVDQAQMVMKELVCDAKSKLTTSKIRNILTLSSDIYNRECGRTEDTLTSDDKVRLQLMRVRVAYEVGRDDRSGAVRSFVEKSKLLQYLHGIGDSREKFISFAHYMEALVAYHRFYGGRDS